MCRAVGHLQKEVEKSYKKCNAVIQNELTILNQIIINLKLRKMKTWSLLSITSLFVYLDVLSVAA